MPLNAVRTHHRPSSQKSKDPTKDWRIFMKTLIEKALEINLASGTAERIVVDGVTFSRIPLAEPVLWVTYKDVMQRTRTLEEVVDVAKKAKKMIHSTGLSWKDYMQLPDRGPDYKSETSIWKNYSCSLSLYSNEFLHESDSVRGLWYYDFRYDYVVILPRDASHMLVAKYYPTETEYHYLKRILGFKHKNFPVNHIEPDYVFFPNKDVSSETMEGIITL